MVQPRAIVVGGGIAGLAAAAGLLRVGWRVTLLEQRRSHVEVGAGLAVTRNGMAALEAVGVGAAVRDVGYQVFVAGTRNHHGRWLMRIPDTRDDPDSTNWVCGVHRGRLHQALATAAAESELVTGAQVHAVEVGDPAGASAQVIWRQDGREYAAQADLVVAADGVGSSVRGQLFPEFQPGYSGKTSWRAVVTDECDVDDRFMITWGPGTEFGALRINEREVYWYGYFQYPADTPFPDEISVVRRHFADWPPDVRYVVDTTRPEQLLRHDVYHLAKPLPSYVQGRIVLIGDAAHAMLPTMGQGANTALEDGVSLGRMLAGLGGRADLGQAMARFDRARRPRTQEIARRSRLTARMGADVRGGWPQVLRDAVLRTIPTTATVKAGSQLLQWSPPPVDSAADPTADPANDRSA